MTESGTGQAEPDAPNTPAAGHGKHRGPAAAQEAPTAAAGGRHRRPSDESAASAESADAGARVA
ncbi:hypothetical protein ACX6XY_18720 [Streptomyces sp. O3]